MFLEKNERLLLMDYSQIPPAGENSPKRFLSISDWQKLEKVGIQTIWLEHFDYLSSTWGHKLDDFLENTNLKILLPFWYHPPPGYEWLRLVDNYNNIDYANPDVGKSIDDFTLTLLDELDDVKDRVQLIYGYNAGEFAWIGDSVRDNPSVPWEVVVEFIVERQKILCSQHNEVWYKLHDFLALRQNQLDWPKRLNDALYAEFPDSEHYRVQHAFFATGGNFTAYNRLALKRNPRSKYFIGSEYVKGLSDNYDEALKLGTWGFITSPIHFLTDYMTLEDWMLEGIKVAIEKLGLEPDYNGAWERRPLTL